MAYLHFSEDSRIICIIVFIDMLIVRVFLLEIFGGPLGSKKIKIHFACMETKTSQKNSFYRKRI